MNAKSTTATPPAEAVDDYELARALVIENQKASTSWLQRQLGVGYNTASKMVERMEADGTVSTPDHVGRREVLVDPGDSSTPVHLAAALAARGARITIGSDGSNQLTIPVDLPNAHRAADDRLRLLIERIERLKEEKKGITDDIKDVYGEAKATGYDAKAMRQVVRLRKMRPDDRREMEAIIDLYKCSLGIS